MKHQEIQRQVFSFLEGRLTGAHLQAFEEHLEGCRECRAHVEKMREVSAVIEHEKAIGIRPFAPSGILARLEQGSEASLRSFPGVIRPVLIAASLLGAIALGTWIGKAAQPDSRANTAREILRQDLYIKDFADELNDFNSSF